MNMKRVVLMWVLLSQVWCFAAENPFNVMCFVGWNGAYRPGQWTPLEITISSTLTEPCEGRIKITTAQDPTQRIQVSQGFVLTPGVPLNLPMVTKVAYGVEVLSLELTTAQGKTCYEHEFRMWDEGQMQRLNSVKTQDLFVGIVGQRQGIQYLTRMAESDYQGLTFNQGNEPPGNIVIEAKQPDMVPWDWTGLVSLDMLILNDPEWSKFNKDQIQAIMEWVNQGGRLIILMGRNPMPASVLTQQLPVIIEPLKENTVTQDWLARWQLNSTQDKQVTCRSLSPKLTGVILYEQEDLPYFTSGLVGFGRVSVFAVNPKDLGYTQQEDLLEFWFKAVDMILDTGTPLSEPGESMSGSQNHTTQIAQRTGVHLQESHMPHVRYAMEPVLGRSIAREQRRIRMKPDDGESHMSPNFNHYKQGSEFQSTSHILDYLYGIKAMRPLSIGWVVLLLLLLAILLGPVDYFVLKRLDRFPLTWVTSLGWIVLFTLGAYYGVQHLRAGDMQLRTVSLVDGVQDQGAPWATQICGLFAPKSDEYELDQLASNQWWSGASAYNGYWYSHMSQNARRVLAFEQRDGYNLPRPLPINIWTMQTLSCESAVEEMPLRAEVTIDQSDLSVTLTNQTLSPITGGMVFLGNGRGLRFQDIGPGKTEVIQGKMYPIRDWGNAPVLHNGEKFLDPFEVMSVAGSQGRSRGIRDYLGQGAAVVCARFDESASPFTVKKGKCQYHHVQFARLVVFPR